MNQIPLNAGKPWSEMDDAELKHQLELGFSMKQVADFLQREEDECRLRAKQKGLPAR